MRSFNLRTAFAVTFLLGFGSPSQAQTLLGIGQTPSPEQIAGWNIDINREGVNLPPGNGSVASGRDVFEMQCSACHGDKGQGGIGDRLVGGKGSLTTSQPIKTVGSYWPYSATLFDYIRRSMPLHAPQTLSNDEVYAVTAYILNLNGIIPDGTTLDAKSLPAVKMPNRDGFVQDPRPDVFNKLEE
ncbi:c-type cytochrome [Pseudaminobacter sp. NGMCC 1.201702]|uniref:c-type cytochrome n=1 Tax=Pseudaminobacter sp. NGMCC 1.201702 TaxID=3391825 RepID=UPI0039F011C9